MMIRHLYETPEHVPRVAEWIYREFWADRAGYSPKTFEGLLRQANRSHAIPASFLAFVASTPAGTVNLIECDDDQRPHLRPWLAALYVEPGFRRCGIGSALVHRVTTEARDLGWERVYLGTDQPTFYERLGAKLVEWDRPGFGVMAFDLR